MMVPTLIIVVRQVVGCLESVPFTYFHTFPFCDTVTAVTLLNVNTLSRAPLPSLFSLSLTMYSQLCTVTLSQLDMIRIVTGRVTV